MSPLPQERKDTGLIVTILVVVVLVVGGLAFAASLADAAPEPGASADIHDESPTQGALKGDVR